MDNNTDNMINVITQPCAFCTKKSVILMMRSQFDRWQGGALIQDVFPEFSDAIREMLISGTCADCWATVFAPDPIEEFEEDNVDAAIERERMLIGFYDQLV